MAEPHTPLEAEEIQRELRAQIWREWIERHWQQLAAGLVALALVAFGIGLWIERSVQQREAAVAAYQQALAAADESAQQKALAQLIERYPDSVYAAMAEMILAAMDLQNAPEHWKRVIAHPEADEAWRWQARLDLARYFLDRGQKAEAREWLQTEPGKPYLQLYYYLKAEAAESDAERRRFLEKAREAPSYDDRLARKIAALLSE